ncbi:MAG: hypothetical protein ACRC2T_03540, partial [Thermoguttaceae bacterium]
SLWATSKGIGIDPGAFISHYPQYVAIMGMSVVLGFVLMVPGGIGAREFVLMKFLTPLFVVALAAMPDNAGMTTTELAKQAAGLAVVVAGAQRGVSIIAEVVIAAVLFSLKPKN